MAAPPARVNPAHRHSQDMLADHALLRQIGRMPRDDQDRQKRLAAALRENLRRRKSQSRTVSDKQKEPDEKS